MGAPDRVLWSAHGHITALLLRLTLWSAHGRITALLLRLTLHPCCGRCCHCTAVACNSSRNVILCCGHLKFSIISKNFTCRCRCRCRSRCRVYSPSAQFQCSAKVGVNSWPRFSSSTAFQNFASPAVKIYPVRMAHCWLAGCWLAGYTFTVLLIPIRVQM